MKKYMPYKIKELYTKWNFPVEPVNILEDVHFKDVKSSNVPNDFDDYCSLFAFLPSMSRPPPLFKFMRRDGVWERISRLVLEYSLKSNKV